MRKKDTREIPVAAYAKRYLFQEQRFHEKNQKAATPPTVTRMATRVEKQPASPKQSAKYAERHTEKWIRITIPETQKSEIRKMQPLQNQDTQVMYIVQTVV